MTVSVVAAARFLATHARILDRRRGEMLVGVGDGRATCDALLAYRNADGGFGHGLEPDLRASGSQPAAALHAFEVMAELDHYASPSAVSLCDWLNSVSLPDGGLPFALPVDDPTGCAPFWARADPTVASLQVTAGVAAQAHRVAARDTEVASHPWLARATAFCLAAIDGRSEAGHAYELMFALHFLAATAERSEEAWSLLQRSRPFVPHDGEIEVEGGLPDERLRPLDLAPAPDSPIRSLLDPSAVERHLDRLESEQEGDGGWPVGWQSYSAAAALEWRGYLTVRALSLLKVNGRL